MGGLRREYPCTFWGRDRVPFIPHTPSKRRSRYGRDWFLWVYHTPHKFRKRTPDNTEQKFDTFFVYHVIMYKESIQKLWTDTRTRRVRLFSQSRPNFIKCHRSVYQTFPPKSHTNGTVDLEIDISIKGCGLVRNQQTNIFVGICVCVFITPINQFEKPLQLLHPSV